MSANLLVELMTEEFILWRCLHSGPLSRRTIDQFPASNPLDWDRYRQRNTPLLLKLTRTYGACAIIARQGDSVVGMLRFYPKVVGAMKGAGYLCLQQDSPAGPGDEFADQEFPPLAAIQDKTLSVHCLMTGSNQQKANPFQRKGLGTQMTETLIDWAQARGWRHIEADSFEDLPIIYEITGSAGHTFWKKLGFHLADRHPHPHLQEENEFVRQLLEQARASGLNSDRARDQLLMRLDLT